MAETTIQATGQPYFRQFEFYVFSVIAFAGKSMLLIRLPYREWPINTLYTGLLLLMFYLYFRFRQNLIAPPFVLFCLAMAVAVDVLGNLLGFYGQVFGIIQYDEFAHFMGSGFSAVPVLWLLRATTLRMGYRLPLALLAFLSVCISFSYCGWYEILELWDELFYGDFQRIHTLHDTANDLQYDLAGVIAFALMSVLYFKLKESRAEALP